MVFTYCRWIESLAVFPHGLVKSWFVRRSFHLGRVFTEHEKELLFGVPLITNRASDNQSNHSINFCGATITQRWPWVGSTHGLGWVRLYCIYVGLG